MPRPASARSAGAIPGCRGASPGERFGTVGTNFAVASSVADGVTCACSTRPATRRRSRSRQRRRTSGTASCPASGRARPTGTGSADRGPGAGPALQPGQAAPRPLRPGHQRDRSRSAPRCSATTRATRTAPSTLDSAAHVPRSLVVGHRASTGGRATGPGTGTRTPSSTRCTSRASPCATRTCRRSCAAPTPGSATRPRSAHLTDLGVTAVELLPGARVRARGVPARPRADQLLGLQHDRVLRAAPGLLGRRAGRRGRAARSAEFKDMVDALHRAGLEVILDVVYNHTAEGEAGRPDAVLPRPRQRGLLPARPRRPARVLRHHRLRQLAQRGRPDARCG